MNDNLSLWICIVCYKIIRGYLLKRLHKKEVGSTDWWTRKQGHIYYLSGFLGNWLISKLWWHFVSYNAKKDFYQRWLVSVSINNIYTLYTCIKHVFLGFKLRYAEYFSVQCQLFFKAGFNGHLSVIKNPTLKQSVGRANLILQTLKQP